MVNKPDHKEADMLLFQTELQDALGDKNKVFSDAELLEFQRSLWVNENQHSAGMMPSSFPLSRYVDSETGEIQLEAVQKLAQHIKEVVEQRRKEIAPIVQQILEKRP